jgi:hypothetical protein
LHGQKALVSDAVLKKICQIAPLDDLTQRLKKEQFSGCDFGHGRLGSEGALLEVGS